MRWQWLLLCGGSFAIVCCGYPEFGFKPKKSTSSASSTTSSSEATTTSTGGGMGGFGGSGGDATATTSSVGGAGGGATTTTAATTTSTSSGGAGTVPCTPGVCALGEVCCYHSADFDCDRCRDPGKCYDIDLCSASGTYSELACDEPNDCFQGGKCCIDLSNGVIASSCKAACDQPNEHAACQDSVCLDGGICAGTGYAGYEVCQ